jgi:hypothetical protein
MIILLLFGSHTPARPIFFRIFELILVFLEEKLEVLVCPFLREMLCGQQVKVDRIKHQAT